MSSNSAQQRTANATSLFKRCPLCRTEWESKEAFLNDDSLHLNGYQTNRRRLKQGLLGGGLLVFTHLREQCGTSMVIEASRFREEQNASRRRHFVPFPTASGKERE